MNNYIDRREFCECFCNCNYTQCDQQKCPIWQMPAVDVTVFDDIKTGLAQAIEMEKGNMTNYEYLRSMSEDNFAEWLDEYGQFDGSPWILWFDEKYCKNCPDVMCRHEDGEREFPCAWCEIHGKCKFFQEMNEIPDNKEIIGLWLESETKDDE